MESKVISESGNNYVKFGNGLLIQWGRITTTATVTFPKPFSNTNYSVAMAISNLSGSDNYNYNTNKIWGVASTLTTTSFNASVVQQQRWIAIGY